MANTHHTGIPRLQWKGTYPPCRPSVLISADLNPFCAGDMVTFTPTFNCVDTSVNTEVNFGLLYNWYAATDVIGFTSSDEWDVNSRTDIQILATYLGGTSIAGGKLKEVGLIYWDSPNTGATNEVGFNARGGGWRDWGTGAFSQIKGRLNILALPQYACAITSTSEAIVIPDNMAFKSYGFSICLVRPATESELLQEDGTPCAPYVGNDLKVYPTVKIGTQVWTAANSAETKFRDGSWIPGFDGGVYTPISNEDWAAATSAMCCAYNDDIDNAYTQTSEITAYAWLVNGVIQGTSGTSFSSNTLLNNDRVGLLFITNTGQSYFSNLITMQEKTDCITDALELTFDDIANVPVADAASVSDWNTFFDLPTYGSPFTSVEVVGNMVRLIGGSGITIKDMLFFENLNLLSVLKGIEIVSVGIAGFGYCDNLTEISLLSVAESGQNSFAINSALEVLNFPQLITAGDGSFSSNQSVNSMNFPLLRVAGSQCFNGLSVNSVFNFPSLLSCGDNCFASCIAATNFYLPLCADIGSTTGYNEVFMGITGQTITLTIPAALMTCNGGAPDGDIQWLQSNNTVTIVTV